MKKLTQEQKVLDYLKRFDYITSYEAFALLFVTRLSAVVYNLKHKRGIVFNTDNEWVSKTNMYGEKRTFKKYSIEK